MFVLLISRGIPSDNDPQWGCFERDQALALHKAGHKVVVLSIDSRAKFYSTKLRYDGDEKLEKLAVRVGREVARTKIPVKLRYMNAYERKIIHNKLSTWRDVTTHSEGIEPRRYLVITPKNCKTNK